MKKETDGHKKIRATLTGMFVNADTDTRSQLNKIQEALRSQGYTRVGDIPEDKTEEFIKYLESIK